MPTRGPDILIGEPATLAARLTDSVRALLAARPRHSSWSLALPGGSVAEHLVSRLATAPLDWNRAHVFFVDERVVPADDARSN